MAFAVQRGGAKEAGQTRVVGWLGASEPPAQLVTHLRTRGLTLENVVAGAPMPPARIAMVEPSSSPATRAPNLSGRRVAVMHPDPGSADALAQALRSKNAEVVALSLNPESLERAEALDPDAVLMESTDFYGSCWEIVRAIWQHPRLRFATILLATPESSGAYMQGTFDVPGLCLAVQRVGADYERVRVEASERAALALELDLLGPARTLRALLEVGRTLRVRFACSDLTVEVDLTENIVVGARGGPGNQVDDSYLGVHALSALLLRNRGRVEARAVDHPAVTNIMAPLDTALHTAREAPAAGRGVASAPIAARASAIPHRPTPRDGWQVAAEPEKQSTAAATAVLRAALTSPIDTVSFAVERPVPAGAPAPKAPARAGLFARGATAPIVNAASPAPSSAGAASTEVVVSRAPANDVKPKPAGVVSTTAPAKNPGRGKTLIGMVAPGVTPGRTPAAEPAPAAHPAAAEPAPAAKPVAAPEPAAEPTAKAPEAAATQARAGSPNTAKANATAGAPRPAPTASTRTLAGAASAPARGPSERASSPPARGVSATAAASGRSAGSAKRAPTSPAPTSPAPASPAPSPANASRPTPAAPPATLTEASTSSPTRPLRASNRPPARASFAPPSRASVLPKSRASVAPATPRAAIRAEDSLPVDDAEERDSAQRAARVAVPAEATSARRRSPAPSAPALDPEPEAELAPDPDERAARVTPTPRPRPAPAAPARAPQVAPPSMRVDERLATPTPVSRSLAANEPTDRFAAFDPAPVGVSRPPRPPSAAPAKRRSGWWTLAAAMLCAAGLGAAAAIWRAPAEATALLDRVRGTTPVTPAPVPAAASPAPAAPPAAPAPAAAAPVEPAPAAPAPEQAPSAGLAAQPEPAPAAPVPGDAPAAPVDALPTAAAPAGDPAAPGDTQPAPAAAPAEAEPQEPEVDELEQGLAEDDARLGRDAARKAKVKRASKLVTEANGLLAKKKFSIAKSRYQQALRAVPNYPRALVGLTQLALAQDDGKQAVSYARLLVKAHDDQAAYQVLLGDAYRSAGQPRQARAAWQAAARAGSALARTRLKG